MCRIPDGGDRRIRAQRLLSAAYRREPTFSVLHSPIMYSLSGRFPPTKPNRQAKAQCRTMVHTLAKTASAIIAHSIDFSKSMSEYP